jgi:outer membrane cobalamin receptor
MRPSSALPVTTLVLLLIAAAPAALAQTASVQGRVVDPSGAPVASATVTLRSGSGLARQTPTREDGAYAFANVPPGSYDLTASAAGFRAEPFRVAVSAADPVVVEIHLALAALTDSVVVSAAFVDVAQSEAALNVTALTRRDVEDRQITMVADALRLAPGVTVAPSGGLGGVTSAFPRGGESDYTLVMIDGVKLNSFGGGFDFGHLTTFGLNQIEVVRGPQSAVFGSDAIGGVVQMRSRVGGAPSYYGLFQTGSYATSRLGAGSSGSKGAVDWGVAVEHAASDGWTADAPNPTLGTVSNDDYGATMAAAAVAWRAGPRSALRATGRFGTNERGNPGPFGSDPIGAYPGIDRVSRGTNDVGLGSVEFTHEWNPRTALRLHSNYLDQRSRFVSPWGESEARTQRFQARGQIDRALTEAFALSAGAALELEQARSSFITGASAQQVPVDRRVAGYFAELRWRRAARLFLTAGLRVDDILRGAIEGDPLGFSPRAALPDDRVVSPNPRAAVSYYLRTSDASGGNWSRLHGSAGTGIRAPDAFEIAFTDNPGLAPERSRSVDAGFEQALAGGLVVLDATYFFNRYDDLIVAVGRSMRDYSRYRTDNIANAEAQGVEASVALRTRRGLEFRAAYTFAATAVLALDGAPGAAPAPFAVGDPLLRRPRHQADVDLLWRHRAITAYVNAGGRASVLDVEPNWGASGGMYSAPGFAVAGAGVAVQVARAIDVLLRADNLFDRRYEAVFGYPAPRRSFTVGVRLAAGR